MNSKPRINLPKVKMYFTVGAIIALLSMALDVNMNSMKANGVEFGSPSGVSNIGQNMECVIVMVGCEGIGSVGSSGDTIIGSKTSNDDDNDGNATESNLEWAKLSITTILRANCGWAHPCDSNFNVDAYGKVKNPYYGPTEGSFAPATKAREGTAHFSFDIPVGTTYSISVEDGWHTWVYGFEEAYMTGDCHSPGPSGERNYCQAVMAPGGHSTVVNLYYKCNDVLC
ncbi:hypothetical protein [Candidatus Nitrosocosmicus hydrocola]|uniref:hypothetical protein n=1 Tax=Candidatus Nitrosocosmicus hydrocola TaxID=1826872 RepID=UPI0011E5DD6C|nr:hypothetical protein [Candidatus Nitrosocosmicus hydrocola]